MTSVEPIDRDALTVKQESRMRIVLANPRGFCAGVKRAIEIVERALLRWGPPIHVYHEIVHNRYVVAELEAKGAIFVNDLASVPRGSLVIFSAHGVSRLVERTAQERGLDVIDATCPMVSKVHAEGRRYTAAGRTVILIGHASHAEIIGTLGQIPGTVKLISTVEEVAVLNVDDSEQLAYITQTTLSVDDTRAIVEALTSRFPRIVGQSTADICYATQNRQRAVRELAGMVDVILVVGSQNSANSNRLREIGEELGVPSYLIDGVSTLDPAWLHGKRSIGITAGASAPDKLVAELVETLQSKLDAKIESLSTVSELVHFRVPARLTDPQPGPASLS